MFDPLSMTAMAALTAAGTMFANKTNKDIAREQMSFQRESNAMQMGFQERMSNTSYQRMIADMEAAGINPIMALNAGGASTPMGASSPGASTTVEDALGPAVSSALQVRRMNADINNLREQNKEIRSQTKLNDKLASVASAEAVVKGLNSEVIKTSLPGLRDQQAVDESPLGKLDRRAQKGLGLFLNTLKKLGPVARIFGK